jgi:hypothetical protein
MRVRIPIEGTVKEITSSGVVIGDDADPIRPVRMSPMPQGIAWEMVELNIEEEWMDIEVTTHPHRKVSLAEHPEICPDRAAAMVEVSERVAAIPKLKRLVRKDKE